jgi:hypothetical protein
MAVEGRIGEHHGRIRALIRRIAPIEEKIPWHDEIVDIHVEADLGKVVEQPDHVLDFGLSGRGRSVIGQIGGIGGGQIQVDGGRRELRGKVPQKIVVAIQIDADLSSRQRAPVLAPAVGTADGIVGHAELAPIGIDAREDEQVNGLKYLADLIARESLRAVPHAVAIAERGQDVGREEDADLGAGPFAGVGAAGEQHAFGLGAVRLADA